MTGTRDPTMMIAGNFPLAKVDKNSRQGLQSCGIICASIDRDICIERKRTDLVRQALISTIVSE